MKRNFKCRSCNETFSADDSTLVTCPRCNSDDIEPINTTNIKKTVIIAVIGFIAAVGIGVGVKFMRQSSTDAENAEALASTDEYGLTEETSGVIVPDETPAEIKVLSLSVSPAVADNNSRTYSFTAKAQNLPEGCTTNYKLTDFGTGKVIRENDNGKFTNVPPATDSEGSYVIELEALKKDGTTESASYTVTGCVKFPEVLREKLTTAQVQELIDNMIKTSKSSFITSNSGIDRNVKFSVIESDGSTKSYGITELYSKVRMLDIWSGYTVVNLGYDSYNKVNHITLKPIMK